MKIENYRSEDITLDNFEIGDGQSWCFFGSNSSGISQLPKAFTQRDPADPATHEKTAVVSFARQQQIYEEELRKDNTDFLDRIDPGTPAQLFIREPDTHRDLIHTFNLHHCMNKGYRQLSSGESRKLMLVSAISHNPEVLLMENPYDGVDFVGCKEIDTLLGYLQSEGYRIIITVNNRCDIPEWCSHIAIVERGRITLQGERKCVLSQLEQSEVTNQGLSLRWDAENPVPTLPSNLVLLKNGFARYGESRIFSKLDLQVNSGQHTLITGPNGSGKSTLLHILTGDNQNCYGNDLRIFGIRRGSGESIWELKKHMGIVSPELHRNHYIPGSALQVVLSGYFDSIGIYRQFTPAQKQQALRWLEMVGLQQKSTTPFRSLSFAEQRLILIARGLIKMPKLLILDEPTQGLDQVNRMALLDFLESIAQKRLSTILYASHRSDEFRSFFKQHLDLSAYRPIIS